MSNWLNLKEAIQSAVKANGNREITGQGLQDALLNIIDSVGQNATFAGVAIPETVPGEPDGPVFYLASTPGTYSGFSDALVTIGELVAFTWEDNTWVSTTVLKVDTKVENSVKVTYEELKLMRDDSKLVAGSYYRITDYVTTITQEGMKSAEHPFDVIVLALSENELSEHAHAILHEGDEYFAHCDLSAWKLMYCLDNDKNRFEWADDVNGKGVIFRMIDEKQNDCPYDFKNILSKRIKYTGNVLTEVYYYTFSYVLDSVIYDGTTEKQINTCYNNRLGKYKNKGVALLNKIVFINTYVNSDCYNNIFGAHCYNNTFDDSCRNNIFGNFCYRNTFGSHCYNNTFDNFCDTNTFGDNCYNNTFGKSCSNNTFGEAGTNNTLGNSCGYNTFGNSCEFITLGNSCSDNTFNGPCSHITLGNRSFYNTFGIRCVNSTFGNNLEYRIIPANTVKTSLTSAEEFYDDGQGKVVPVKHPDLSTQPSILPYKFMGQYVYEKLLYLGKKKNGPKDIQVSSSEISKSCLILQADIIVHEEIIDENTVPKIIGCASSVIPVTASIDTASRRPLTTIIAFTYELPEIVGETSFSDNADIYARIVYTSIPVESGYYGQEYYQ